jgi:hypothetical protein
MCIAISVEFGPDEVCRTDQVEKPSGEIHFLRLTTSFSIIAICAADLRAGQSASRIGL